MLMILCAPAGGFRFKSGKDFDGPGYAQEEPGDSHDDDQMEEH